MTLESSESLLVVALSLSFQNHELGPHPTLLTFGSVFFPNSSSFLNRFLIFLYFLTILSLGYHPPTSDEVFIPYQIII